MPTSGRGRPPHRRKPRARRAEGTFPREANHPTHPWPRLRELRGKSRSLRNAGEEGGRTSSAPGLPGLPALPKEAAGSGKRNIRGTEAQAVAAHLLQLWAYTGSRLLHLKPKSNFRPPLPRRSHRCCPLIGWKELSFNRGSSPASVTVGSPFRRHILPLSSQPSLPTFLLAPPTLPGFGCSHRVWGRGGCVLPIKAVTLCFLFLFSWIFTGRTNAEAEAPILWPPDVKNWLIGKEPDAGKDWRQEEKGVTEEEMIAWHHRLKWNEFEQAPGVGEGQEGLACCSPWGSKESDTTEQLNNNYLISSKSSQYLDTNYLRIQ